MDALSEVLKTVRMTGAIFFDVEFTAPWEFAVPPLQHVADVLAAGTERLLSFHLLTEGKALARVAGAPGVPLAAGDVLLLPHDDALTVSNGSPAMPIDGAEARERFLRGDLTSMRFGGGGEATRFVCGHFGCERRADKLFLAGLPAMIRINIRGDPAGRWLEGTIRHLVSETRAGRPGHAALLSKLAEALFVETLRRYMERLPPEQTGWLAAARDPLVGRALALLHRKPHQAWTVAQLAVEVGASRTIVADRFVRLLGEPPLRYLARWRLQLAARVLQTTQRTVLQVASEVGYESQAAFNRAFKREFGLPPAHYRRKLAENGRSGRARRHDLAEMRGGP